MRPLEGVRILVVEDHEETLEVFHVALKVLGAVVTCASTARAAWLAFQGSRPDVVLSDLAMPEDDGYWLIRQIRALSPAEGGSVPAVAVTAHGSPDTIAAVRAAGFQAHLVKPVDMETLVATVHDVTAS